MVGLARASGRSLIGKHAIVLVYIQAKRVPMMLAVPFFAMLDTMPEDFVRLNSGEINFLIASLQYLDQGKQKYLESHCNVKAEALYAKLFNSWHALSIHD